MGGHVLVLGRLGEVGITSIRIAHIRPRLGERVGCWLRRGRRWRRDIRRNTGHCGGRGLRLRVDLGCLRLRRRSRSTTRARFCRGAISFPCVIVFIRSVLITSRESVVSFKMMKNTHSWCGQCRVVRLGDCRNALCILTLDFFLFLLLLFLPVILERILDRTNNMEDGILGHPAFQTAFHHVPERL